MLKRFFLKNSAFYLAAGFFVVDRFLKYLAMQGKSFYFFSLAKNPFIAFSIPLRGQLLNISIILSLIGLIYLFFFYLNKKRFFATALSFVILGALSNLMDRFAYGYVIDYVHFFGLSIFNLADAMIIFGVIPFALWL